jgi:hypothetical protein
MNESELIKILQQINELTERALSKNIKSPKKHDSKAQAKSNSRKGSLQDVILAMRAAGYFKQPKTVGDVHEKVQLEYPCERDRVAMSLLRLLRRKELRKASKLVDKKKKTAYVW